VKHFSLFAYPDRVAKRTFKQARALETRQALIDAAARLFAKRGYEPTQTPDIAAEAGVSTGAFYRYFRDKHAILLEALAQHIDRGRALVAEKLRPEKFLALDPRAAIDGVLDVVFELVARDAKLNRVYVAMSFTDPDVAALRARIEADDREKLATLLATAIPKSRIPDPHAAVLVMQLAALEVAGERAGLHPTRGRAVSDLAVRTALREMFYRYLFDEPKKRKAALR
jgi:AcrR family transcriptional regulator